MLETQAVLAIYAAALLYLGGNLAGPTWMRRPGTCELPGGLRPVSSSGPRLALFEGLLQRHVSREPRIRIERRVVEPKTPSKQRSPIAR